MSKYLLSLLLMVLPLSCLALDIRTPGGMLSVQLPTDFTPLSQRDLELKYGRGARLPLAAYGNKTQTTTMAVSWGMLSQSKELTEDDLDQTRTQLQDGMKQQIPGIKWLVSELRTINGRRWIYLEYMSPARDTRMHNVTYATALHGNLLMLNLSATVADLPAYKQAFKTAGASLQAH